MHKVKPDRTERRNRQSTPAVEDFNTSLSVDRNDEPEVNEYLGEWKTINQLNLMDIFRVLHHQ